MFQLIVLNRQPKVNNQNKTVHAVFTIPTFFDSSIVYSHRVYTYVTCSAHKHTHNDSLTNTFTSPLVPTLC